MGRAGFSVVFDVGFSCFGTVVRSMGVMTVGQVGVMRGLFVTTRFVMLGCFLVVSGGMFVMLRRLMMMLCCLHGHNSPPTACVREAMRCTYVNEKMLTPICYGWVTSQ